MLFAETDFNGVATVITAVFSGIAAVIASVGAVYAIRAHSQSKENLAEVQVVKADVHKIELATNSMKDALVEKTSQLGVAQGKAEGRAELRAEQKVDTDASQVPTPVKLVTIAAETAIVNPAAKPDEPPKK